MHFMPAKYLTKLTSTCISLKAIINSEADLALYKIYTVIGNKDTIIHNN